MAVRASLASDFPTHVDMLWPTLQALKQLGNSASIQEIEERVTQLAGYSELQQAILHGKGPQTEISYRLAWARTYLKNVDAIARSSRGVWAITDYGQTLTEADMPDIVRRVIATFARRANTKENTNQESAQGFEQVVLAEDQAEGWQDKLLEILYTIPPDGFERLCRRLLRESGFTKVEVTGRSGDGGIDGIGVLRMALLSFQVFFQCKRYRGNVGAAAVRDFRGAMVGRTDKGLLITTGSFTPDARREATRDGAPVLDLIDGDDLCQLLKEKALGVHTEMVEKVTINSTWFEQI
jgi:restriction system protein